MQKPPDLDDDFNPVYDSGPPPDLDDNFNPVFENKFTGPIQSESMQGDSIVGQRPQRKEPDTYWGGFRKGLGDYFTESIRDPSMLQSAANPQTTGDMLNLVIPAALPNLRNLLPKGKLPQIAKSVSNGTISPRKAEYEPLPPTFDDLPDGGLSTITPENYPPTITKPKMRMESDGSFTNMETGENHVSAKKPALDFSENPSKRPAYIPDEDLQEITGFRNDRNPLPNFDVVDDLQPTPSSHPVQYNETDIFDLGDIEDLNPNQGLQTTPQLRQIGDGVRIPEVLTPDQYTHFGVDVESGSQFGNTKRVESTRNADPEWRVSIRENWGEMTDPQIKRWIELDSNMKGSLANITPEMHNEFVALNEMRPGPKQPDQYLMKQQAEQTRLQNVAAQRGLNPALEFGNNIPDDMRLPVDEARNEPLLGSEISRDELLQPAERQDWWNKRGQGIDQLVTDPSKRFGNQVLGVPDEGADFVGWMPGFEEIPEQALFNLRGGNNAGSSVGIDELTRRGIAVPHTPAYNPNNLTEGAIRQKPPESPLGNAQRFADRLKSNTGSVPIGPKKPFKSREIKEPTIAELDKEYKYQIQRYKATNNGRDFTSVESEQYFETMEKYSAAREAAGMKQVPMPEPEFGPSKRPGWNDETGSVPIGPNLPPRITLKNPSPSNLKKAQEMGYELDGLGEDGKWRMKYTGKKSSTILEEDIPSKSKTTKKVNNEIGLPRQIYDLSRGMMSVDPPFVTSAAFRQAAPLAGTKNWFKAWASAAKSFGSENWYNARMKQIQEGPLFKSRPLADGKVGKSFAEEIGLRMTDLKHTRNARMEGIRSNLAESIPVYGRYIKASNRAFSGFLNDLRANQLDAFVKDGLVISKAHGDDSLNLLHNVPLAKEYAEFLNDATGAGTLKTGIGKHEYSLENHASKVADALFSPRLMARNIRMLNPNTYLMASPQVRKQYVHAMLRTVGAWWGMAQLGKMAGADVVTDPTNPDFGKIKIGNTRLDPGAGFQQFLVLGSRIKPEAATVPGVEPTDTGIMPLDLATGLMGTPGNQYSSSISGESRQFGVGLNAPTKRSNTVDFMANKLHPTAKLFWDIASANERQPVYLGDRAIQMYVPMMAGDISELLQENPELLPLVLPFTGVGGGSQTYDGSPIKPQFTPFLGLEEYDYRFGGKDEF